METILTIVVLTTTLVLLYGSYSQTLTNEKKKLYYDDISYIYKTLAIRDVFDKSVNNNKFNTAVDNASRNYYFYMFGSQSDIFDNNSLMQTARDLYHYDVLIYVPLANITTLKNCINTGSSTTDTKCRKSLEHLSDFADSSFNDYFKTINVNKNKVDSDKIKGILISLIYETKNGNEKIGQGGYETCLRQKIYSSFGVTNSTDTAKKNAVNNYYKQGLTFDMYCENAYYYSWVYL